MAKYALSNVIYENRVRRKITQEELCYGICAPVTLSRIENGMQMPRRKIYEGLMQRLGLRVPYYFQILSNEDLERSNLEYIIISKLSLNEYDIEELLIKYKNCSSEMDHMEKQFYMYASALAEQYRKPDMMEELMKRLLEAISLTIPDFSIYHPERVKFLTFDEITIINSIATNCYSLGKREEAKLMLLYLKDYLEHKDIDQEEKAKVYPMILFHLSNWLGAEGKNELAYELCDTGIDYCIQYGKLALFPKLIFNKAHSLGRMNRLEEAIPYFRQACMLFEAVKDYEKANLCKKEVYETFSVKI